METRFWDIERETFGEDGFDDGVKQASQAESEIGLADLAAYTAPEPPAR